MLSPDAFSMNAKKNPRHLGGLLKNWLSSFGGRIGEGDGVYLICLQKTQRRRHLEEAGEAFDAITSSDKKKRIGKKEKKNNGGNGRKRRLGC